ncbi:MAG: hypothetical protein ACOZIN_16725 [Myxococcota bacterium]
MADAKEKRELRDKIEALQSELRKSQERNKKLHKRCAEAEAEAARLAAELRKHTEKNAAVPDSSPADRRLVALARTPENIEDAVLLLSSLPGLSTADARLRLRAPPPSPLIILPSALAEALCEALRDNGFASVSCDARIQLDRTRVQVRGFALEDEGIRFNPQEPGPAFVPFAELSLLIRGTRVVERPETELSPLPWQMRGGTKKDKRRSEHVTDFLWVYSRAGAKFELSHPLDFGGLGERMRPLARQNMQVLVETLRQRAPQVVYDQQLVRMARWSLALLKDGDKHEAVAELIWQAVLAGHWSAA